MSLVQLSRIRATCLFVAMAFCALSLCGCSQGTTPARQSASAQDPLSRALALYIHPVDQNEETCTLTIECRNITKSPLTLPPAQATCRVSARRFGGAVEVAAQDVALRWMPKRGGAGGTSVESSLTLPPFDSLEGTVDLRMPGPGRYTFEAHLIAAPGVKAVWEDVLIR